MKSGCHRYSETAPVHPVPLLSGSLLFASTFERHYMALAAGAFEFVVLSGRPVKAVAGLAQHCQLHAWFSLVLNGQRLGWVRASGNRGDFHLCNLAHGAADLLSDLTEGVQVFEGDRYLLHLSHWAHSGK